MKILPPNIESSGVRPDRLPVVSGSAKSHASASQGELIPRDSLPGEPAIMMRVTRSSLMEVDRADSEMGGVRPDSGAPIRYSHAAGIQCYASTQQSLDTQVRGLCNAIA